MKNKKGFTLIELLAVIVIIAVTSAIASFAISNILNKNKEKALETKENIILKQAIQYARDYEETLFHNSSKMYGNYVCEVITIGDLVTAGYVNEDDNDVDGGQKDVRNPVNGQSMKNRKIVLYIKSSENPSDINYSTIGKYVGTVLSKFDVTSGTSLCH